MEAGQSSREWRNMPEKSSAIFTLLAGIAEYSASYYSKRVKAFPFDTV
jgi:hypothetical protein